MNVSGPIWTDGGDAVAGPDGADETSLGTSVVGSLVRPHPARSATVVARTRGRRANRVHEMPVI